MLKFILHTVLCASMFLGPWWTVNAHAANEAQRTIDTVLAGEVIKSQNALHSHYAEQGPLDVSQAKLHQLAFQIASSQLEQRDLPFLQRAVLSQSLKKFVPVAYEYVQHNASHELQKQWAHRLQSLGLDMNSPDSVHELAQNMEAVIEQIERMDAHDPMVQWLTHAKRHLQNHPSLTEAEAVLYNLSGVMGEPDAVVARNTMQLNDVLAASPVTGAAVSGGFWRLLGVGALAILLLSWGCRCPR